MFCKNCGAVINDNAVICVKCGCQVTANKSAEGIPATEISPKSGVAALILCIFLGSLGVHSFYAGRIGCGIGQLLTLGGCGIWTLVDLIMIIVGSFKDGEGKTIKI